MNKDFFDKLLIFLSALSYTLFDREGLIVYFYVIQLIFFAYYFIFVFRRKTRWKNKSNFIRLYFLFFILCGISLFWSIDISESFSRLKTIFLILLNLIITFDFFKKTDTVDYFLFAIITSTYINFFFLIKLLPDSPLLWDTWRFQGTRDNPNYLASLQLISISSVIILTKIYHYRFYLFKLISSISILMSCYLVFLTGSKKGILFCSFLMVFLVVDYFLLSKLNFKKVAFTIISFIIIVQFSANIFISLDNNIIVEKVFIRFNEFFSGEGLSTEDRVRFIYVGFDYFLENPFFGVGIGALTTKLGTYSHSNFIEMLAGLGFFGFLVFYSIYFNLYQSIKKLKNKMHKAFFYVYLLCLFLMDFTQVTYYYKFSILNLFVLFYIVDSAENLSLRTKKKNLSKIKLDT